MYDPPSILPWPERIHTHTHTQNPLAISYDTRLKCFSSVIHFPHLKRDKYTHTPQYMHKNLGNTALPCYEGAGNVKLVGRQPKVT